MQIRAQFRDPFPKMDLDGKFLGDSYPLCSDLPSKAFLKPGAVYSFLGSSSQPVLHAESGHIILNASTSALYQFLTADPQAAGEITLMESLPCDGSECLVDTVTVVGVIAAGSNTPVFWEYLQIPCVRLAFYDNPTAMKGNSWTSDTICGDPLIASAGAACCTEETTESTSWVWAYPECEFSGEKVTFATAEARCHRIGAQLCVRHMKTASGLVASHEHGYLAEDKCAYHSQFTWTDRACALRVQVRQDGMISIFHDWSKHPNDHEVDELYAQDSNNYFKVRWSDEQWPTAATNCSWATSNCAVHRDTCLCDTLVEETSFTDTSRVPEAAEVLQNLHIGSPPLSMFAPGQYSECTTALCAAAADEGVTVFLARDTGSPLELTSETVFRVFIRDKPAYLVNRISTVHVPGGFSFRNPPHFLGPSDGRAQNNIPDHRDAYHETESLITHLFHHQNTPPLIAGRLIQRLTTSNPSRRYVKAVAQAFIRGEHHGIGSREYGCLAATAAAILLDKEARSTSLEADPNHGALREPIIKVLHLLRAMEYEPLGSREIAFFDMAGVIGMAAYEAPSVFNFYLPDYRPAGPIDKAGLVSPEAEIATAPLLIGFLNGMISLIDYGLTECGSGFGMPQWLYNGIRGWRRSCNSEPADIRGNSDGILRFQASAAAIDELDLLLTGGRLRKDPAALATVQAAYDAEIESVYFVVQRGPPTLETHIVASHEHRHVRCCADTRINTGHGN
eukprot:SAG31_NODE_2540_length_5538_cov_7.680859_4_plen_734_part_01